MVKAEGTSLYICCPQDPGSIWSDSTSEIIDPHSNEVLVTFNNPATVRTALQYSKYDVNPVCSFGNHVSLQNYTLVYHMYAICIFNLEI